MNSTLTSVEDINLQDRLVIDGGRDSGKKGFLDVPPEDDFNVPGFNKSHGFDVGGYSVWQTCYLNIPEIRPKDEPETAVLSTLKDVMSRFITYGRRAGLLFGPAQKKWDVTDPERKYGVYVSEFTANDSIGKKGMRAILDPTSKYIKTKKGFVERKSIDPNTLRNLFENLPLSEANDQIKEYLQSDPAVVAINLVGNHPAIFEDSTWDAYVLERKN